MTIIEFNEKVMDYLEYLNYPELITDFEPSCVAESISQVIRDLYLRNISFRLTAIIIVSLTYEHQIIPHANRMVKH
jgi:hypothetical protein